MSAANTQVMISVRRLQELEDAEARLAALEVHGVDNWEGYDEAIQSLEDEDQC